MPLFSPTVLTSSVTATKTRTKTENVLVLGAGSGIAKALCHVLAARGCALVLAGRRTEELERQAEDLRIRHQTDVHVESFDASDFESHADFYARCRDQFDGQVDGVVLCHGYMVPQDRTQTDFDEARRTIDVNFTSAVSILGIVANDFEARRAGWIAAISSVAGDRGRQSNYTYGAAKAALSTWLQGLRNRLHRHGVVVLTIKPGFVDTPMTHGLLNPRSPLVATPERVARDIDSAIRRRSSVLYTPWFWRGIMTIITAIPEMVFKRLKL